MRTKRLTSRSTLAIDADFLDHVARDLPIIRPIKEFIHLNLLLPYQHLNFWQALEEVSFKLEAMPFPEMSFYRAKILKHEIPLQLIEEKLAHLSASDRAEVLDHILRSDFTFNHHDVRIGSLQDEWNKLLKINVIQLSDGMLIKWLGMFMDQGISHWQMPGSDSKSFYQCVRDLIGQSHIKPHPFNKIDLPDLFPENAEEAIALHLSYLCPSQELHRDYCQEAIMTLRGWAGLIFSLQKNPELLSFPRSISLIDFLAVKLVLEKAWVMHENPADLVPDFSGVTNDYLHPFTNKNLFVAFKVCQQAAEEVTYQKVLIQILQNQQTLPQKIKFQSVFCMDDRECGLRRHLEESTSEIETFGTAGHFGIEALYQHSDDPFPKKQCPAPVQAKFILRDLVPIEKFKSKNKSRGLQHHQIQPSENLVVDWLFSFVDAISSFFQLTFNLFFPLVFQNLENVREIKLTSKLQLQRNSLLPPDGQLKEGYTEEEMASLVFGQLQVIGFTHYLAPLVFFIGHGSTSANNPYFASYGCGACSGRPGSANARAIVQMANNNNVRILIETKFGMKIPDGTYFVAGFHDTCRDVIQLFDTYQLPPAHLPAFKQFKQYLSSALLKNAIERSKAFKQVSYKTISHEAQKEVLRRSHSLFETRPELGHTNASFAIVGRRSITKNLNLSRRSFLQSYDYTTDPEGIFLAQILGAVIPVCSGINLDYFFSRVDNMRFGAGSKLPHNIVGNIGMSHGTESDLLFGLPFQMIDQHQPLRLLVLVEQTPEVALKAIQGNALVKQIVTNNWIHYACFDQQSKSFYFFQDGSMINHSMEASYV